MTTPEDYLSDEMRMRHDFLMGVYDPFGFLSGILGFFGFPIWTQEQSDEEERKMFEEYGPPTAGTE